ncbi:hypothetical protein N7468_007824 [Penicillium chermesinum]|uniref:Uncharacterized protein n=1 Tax=Penicillium chermesinum TaxID=63820 RepID=A0A9W9NNK3_9EURO|nr:uncharacterized protein N7468_007824 [Penicillium chermesinum]KAJ5223282.1 hypothetical protein N7468_007824 [Penicillium chermesinum]
MQFSTALIASVAALVPMASAVGHAVVKNNCAHTVYLWSVGGSVGPMQTVAPGKSYSEVLHHDPQSGGISIKITKTANGLYDGSAQTDFATLLTAAKSGTICLMSLGTLSLEIPSLGSQVKDCQSTTDITLNLCGAKC